MRKPLLLSFLILFCSTMLQAQWTNYSTANTKGIYSGCMNDIVQTSDGTLWFATQDKLWSFQASQNAWSSISLPSPFNSCMIYTLHVDLDGQLWIGTEFGTACRSHNGTWQTFNSSNGLAGNVVRGICHDNYGNLWFATYDGGLSRLSNGTWTYYGIALGLPTYGYLSAFCDSQGRLWFGTASQGVLLRNFSGWHQYTIADVLAGNSIYGIMEDKDHKIFMSGQNGLTTYFNGWWATIGIPQGMPSSFAYQVCQVNDTTLYIATDSGIAVFQYPAISLIRQSDGLSENAVMTVFKDMNGRIWAGHKNAGVSFYEDHQWHYYSVNSGILSNSVYDVAEDPDGSMWFATYGGLSRLYNNEWTTLRTTQGLPQNSVDEIEIQSNGRLWCVFNNGSIAYKTDTNYVVFNTTSGLLGNVQSIYIDSLDQVWVGYSYTTGISRFTGASWAHEYPGTLTTTQNDILAIPGGDIWVATISGVFRKHNGAWIQYLPADGIPSINVSSITRDPQGRIWISCDDYYSGGIAFFENEQWTSIQADYPTKSIKRSYADSDGRIWVGGLIYYAPYTRVLSCMQNSNWIYYSNNDGLGGRYFQNFFEDSHHRMWAVSSDGGISVLTLTAVAIQETSAEISDIRLYPNPADDHFILEFKNGKASSVLLRLIDINGRCCYERKYSVESGIQDPISVSCVSLESGIYSCFIQTNVGFYQSKVIIIHP